MSNREYGWNKEVKTKRYWGGRGIISLEYGLDIPWDRQSYEGDENSKEFTDWINKEAIPYLTKRVKNDLLNKQDEVVKMDSADGRFCCEATCNKSGGYLYIGCWEI